MLMPLEVSGAHLHVLTMAIYSVTAFYTLGMNVAFLQRQKVPLPYKKNMVSFDMYIWTVFLSPCHCI